MDIPTELPASASDDQTGSARAVTIACIVLVFLTLVLRTIGRYCLKLKYGFEHPLPVKFTHFLGMDDVFNLLAVLTFWGLTVAVLIAIDRGMGMHIEVVLYRFGAPGLDRYNLTIYTTALLYNTTLGLIKLSVLSLYRRILTGIPSPTLPLLNWAAFALVATNTLINVFVAAFQCSPPRAAFSVVPGARCINAAAFYLGNASTGIFTDVLVYGLAVPIVRPLQMAPRKKAQTLVTLLVGAFAVVTSCVRMAFLPALLKDADTTYAMAIPMAWSVAEPTVGIVVSSMPAMRAIRFLWGPEMKGSGFSAGSSGGGSKQRSDGHIQLVDMPERQKVAVSAAARRAEDDGSEEGLVFGGEEEGGRVRRTTRVEVEYQ